MLRLDKTISRKTTLHADQATQAAHDAQDAAYWAAKTPAERKISRQYARQQLRALYALSQARTTSAVGVAAEPARKFLVMKRARR